MPYTIPSYTVSPGAVYQPKSKLILDRIPGAIAAWSTRRLISSAPADIARGRDASTTEEDFTAAELAGTGFTDLAGAGDGFYVTLYDQIGSNNATQSTAGSQPKGVGTGTLITNGVNPVLALDGSDDALKVADNAAFNWSTELSVCIWAKNTNPSLASVQSLLGKYDTGANGREFRIAIDTSNKLFFQYGNADGTFRGTLESDDAVIVQNSNLYSFVFSTGALSLYLNGSQMTASVTSGTEPPTSLPNRAADFTIGSILNSGAIIAPWDGELNDIIIFSRALSGSEISQLHTALA